MCTKVFKRPMKKAGIKKQTNRRKHVQVYNKLSLAFNTNYSVAVNSVASDCLAYKASSYIHTNECMHFLMHIQRLFCKNLSLVNVCVQTGVTTGRTVGYMSMFGYGMNSLKATLTLTTSNILHPRPPVEDHGAMVIYMQKAQLVVLFPQYEEDLQYRMRETES